MTKTNKDTDAIKLPQIYKNCHYSADDIITKWCVDNRTYSSNHEIEEAKIPQGYNLQNFDNSINSQYD